jgi:receptor expression-enhancing protein 5/6
MEIAIGIAQKVGLQLLLEPQTSSHIFRAACTTVGTAYPSYASYKALENKDPLNKDDAKWLTYWTVHGVLSMVESFTDQLKWFPYYYHAKFALILWLQLPQTQGAKIVYENAFRPVLYTYQPQIDHAVEKMAIIAAYVFSMYKVPIDNVMKTLQVAYSQIKEFLLSDNKPKPGGLVR